MLPQGSPRVLVFNNKEEPSTSDCNNLHLSSKNIMMKVIPKVMKSVFQRNLKMTTLTTMIMHIICELTCVWYVNHGIIRRATNHLLSIINEFHPARAPKDCIILGTTKCKICRNTKKL